MEAVQAQTRAGGGYDRTGVRQFTVFLESRVGRLTALLRALEEGEQNVHAISVEESGDAALVRLICSSPDAAEVALEESRFAFSQTDVLVVALPADSDEPLLTITQCLLTAEINIHYVYSMLRTPAGPALALYVDDPTFSSQLLLRKGFRLLSEADLKAGGPDESEGD